MVPVLVLLVFFGGFAIAGAGIWLLAQRLLGGADWQKRLDRLEAEVKRLRDGETRLELEDEVRRLDEKVEFLEALLADRPKPGALPAGDMEDSGADPHVRR